MNSENIRALAVAQIITWLIIVLITMYFTYRVDKADERKDRIL